MNKNGNVGSGHNSLVGSLSRRGSQELLSKVNKGADEDSSSTEVSGLEPQPTTVTQPPDSKVDTTAKKLTKSVSSSSSGSSNSSASDKQTTTTQPGAAQTGATPPAAAVGVPLLMLPTEVVPQQPAAANDSSCCTGAVKYAIVGGVAMGFVLAFIAALGAYGDQSDNLEEQALRNHMALSAGLSALGGFLGGAGFGKLYHYFHHEVM